MSEKPDYLKEYDGGVEITLAKPATIGGAKVSVLRMREPKVRDLEAAGKIADLSAAAQEVQLFANLLEISADEVRELSLRNHKRVQDGFGLFTD